MEKQPPAARRGPARKVLQWPEKAGPHDGAEASTTTERHFAKRTQEQVLPKGPAQVCGGEPLFHPRRRGTDHALPQGPPALPDMLRNAGNRISKDRMNADQAERKSCRSECRRRKARHHGPRRSQCKSGEKSITMSRLPARGAADFFHSVSTKKIVLQKQPGEADLWSTETILGGGPDLIAERRSRQGRHFPCGFRRAK